MVRELASVEVKPFRGAPTVHVNGAPVCYMTLTTLGTYKYARNPILFCDGKYQRDFTAAGYNIFAFSALNGWIGPDRYDYRDNDLSIEKIVEVNPNAYVVLKLRVGPPAVWMAEGRPGEGSGQWWLDAHPEEAVLTGQGMTLVKESHPPISYASKKFRADCTRTLRRYFDHIRKQPYADRIIGLAVCWGGEEWLYPGWTKGEFPDYNPQVRDMFRDWLKRRYHADVSLLRRAWHNDRVTFDTAEIPSEDERKRNDNFAFRNPETSQHVIDYCEFFGHLSAETILFFAKVYKEATDGKLMVGVHYGYIQELSKNPLRLQNEGHLALSEVLASPLIDFYFSPQSYSDRSVGQTSTPMIPVAAVTLRNKMHYIESDTRTFLSPPNAGYGRCSTLDETIQVLRREFVLNLCNRSYVSWLEFGQTPTDAWYGDPELRKTCGLAHRIGNASLRFDRSSAAQIAVIVDARSATYQSVYSKVPSTLIGRMHYKLNRVGAPYDMYLLTDLEDIPLEQYRMFLFLNVYAPDEKTRKLIKDRVASDERLLVWMYAPGYIRHDRFSIESMEDLTGIVIRKRDVEQPLELTITQPGPLKLKTGHAIGETFPVGPVFYADDPAASVIGRLNLERLPGLCMKKLDGHTSAYVAVPTASAELLRALATQAGVHVYSEAGDALYANHRFLGVHTATAGNRRLVLPKTSGVYDVYGGELAAKNARQFFTGDLQAGTTRLYFLGTEEEIQTFASLIAP